jgi:hypothetical protein
MPVSPSECTDDYSGFVDEMDHFIGQLASGVLADPALQNIIHPLKPSSIEEVCMFFVQRLALALLHFYFAIYI